MSESSVAAAPAGWRDRLAGMWGRLRRPQQDLPVRDWVSTGRPTQMQGFDQALVWVGLALLALGLVMVYSASIALPDNPRFARYASSHFLTRHVVSIAGTSTSMRSTKAARNIQGAYFSQVCICTCTTMSAATNARAIDTTWRVRKWLDA